MNNSFHELLKSSPLIAILRGITPEETPTVCDVLYEAGIRLLEIPLNSPQACRSIAIAVEHCGKRQIVGAGTVLSPENVHCVHLAGGEFIISPNTNQEVIRTTKKLNMISIPGFFTASEGLAALNAGADYLKLFPAILGPRYIKDLKSVVKAPVLAVGGINADNISGFFEVCAGVGVGSSLYQAGKTPDEISNNAEKLISAWHQARNH